MKIAHVTATFPPYRGGTGTVCWENARALAARGQDVTVFTVAGRTGRGELHAPPNVTVKRVRPVLRAGNAALTPQLAFVLRPFDVIHLHYPFYGGAEYLPLARRPYVVTYHQDALLSGWQRLAIAGYEATLGRWVLRGAERLCPTSMDYAMSSVHASEFRQRRTRRLSNGVDTRRFTPDPAPDGARGHLAADVTSFVLLFVGALDRAHAFKGVNALIRAVRAAPGSVSLAVVGDGNCRQAYESYARQLGIHDRVRFLGSVSDELLPAYYRASDAVVLPSVSRGEAFGVVLLEAMASGKPVIATALPGVRTVVADGVDGLLARPADDDSLAEAIRHIAGLDFGRRNEMGRAGRTKVEVMYDWNVVADGLLAIYEEVLSRH